MNQFKITPNNDISIDSENTECLLGQTLSHVSVYFNGLSMASLKSRVVMMTKLKKV